MPSNPLQSTPTVSTPNVPEKYLIAFVIQGDDVFKITADNIVHTTGTADGPAFDAIAKLKAAAALLELTNRHKERPDELRKMARELAGEGMKLMAFASSTIRPVPAAVEEADVADEMAADETAEMQGPAGSGPMPGLEAPAAQPLAQPGVQPLGSPRISLISS